MSASTAHMYLFNDACPSDWLDNGHDEQWHTIANFAFQSAPDLQAHVDAGKPHVEVLDQDREYVATIAALREGLPSRRLMKWKTGPGYRSRFIQRFADICNSRRLLVSACSFQEKTLRASTEALLKSYNAHIGGMEGRGIGFEKLVDAKGRPYLKHSLVDMTGLHEIQGPENRMLVLLFMSWFIADQYASRRTEARRHGCDRLAMTVVSDRLSGDDDSRQISEELLRWLIDPEADRAPILLTRSPNSDEFSGDLVADNLAGWLNAAMNEPVGPFAAAALKADSTGVWRGWHMLRPSAETLQSEPAVSRLTSS